MKKPIECGILFLLLGIIPAFSQTDSKNDDHAPESCDAYIILTSRESLDGDMGIHRCAFSSKGMDHSAYPFPVMEYDRTHWNVDCVPGDPLTRVRFSFTSEQLGGMTNHAKIRVDKEFLDSVELIDFDKTYPGIKTREDADQFGEQLKGRRIWLIDRSEPKKGVGRRNVLLWEVTLETPAEASAKVDSLAQASWQIYMKYVDGHNAKYDSIRANAAGLQPAPDDIYITVTSNVSGVSPYVLRHTQMHRTNYTEWWVQYDYSLAEYYGEVPVWFSFTHGVHLKVSVPQEFLDTVDIIDFDEIYPEIKSKKEADDFGGKFEGKRIWLIDRSEPEDNMEVGKIILWGVALKTAKDITIIH